VNAAPRSGVQVHNFAGRKGVPTARSFERWFRATLRGQARKHWHVNIAVVGTRQARELNRRYRALDYATNVLSFPFERLPGQKSSLLGDLALCAPVIAREAAEQGKLPRDHFAHLTIHGVLHLLGFDHESQADAERMENLERKILGRLGLPDPYASRYQR